MISYDFSQKTPIATIHDLSFGFEGEQQFIHRLSHVIAAGLTVVSGEEGSGKTTLLRLLAGELAPSLGTIERPQEVFWISPRMQDYDRMTTAEFLIKQAASFTNFNSELAAELASALGLDEHLEKPMYMLSSGSKRKVWIAAGFASGADLTLIDDPFGALDKGSRDVVLELLQEAAEHQTRAWVIADYVTPKDVVPVATIRLALN